jgi:hypothetical protein
MSSVSRRIRKAAKANRKLHGQAPVPRVYTARASWAPVAPKYPPTRKEVFAARARRASEACVRHPKRGEEQS